MPSNFYVIMTKCLNSLVYLQLSFSPRFCGGFGMADGEGCERLLGHFLDDLPKRQKK